MVFVELKYSKYSILISLRATTTVTSTAEQCDVCIHQAYKVLIVSCCGCIVPKLGCSALWLFLLQGGESSQPCPGQGHLQGAPAASASLGRQRATVRGPDLASRLCTLIPWPGWHQQRVSRRTRRSLWKLGQQCQQLCGETRSAL